MRSRSTSGLPSTSMRSLSWTLKAGLVSLRPFTDTLPSAIHCSASRREQAPARAIALAMRSPAKAPSFAGASNFLGPRSGLTRLAKDGRSPDPPAKPRLHAKPPSRASSARRGGLSSRPAEAAAPPRRYPGPLSPSRGGRGPPPLAARPSPSAALGFLKGGRSPDPPAKSRLRSMPPPRASPRHSLRRGVSPPVDAARSRRSCPPKPSRGGRARPVALRSSPSARGFLKAGRSPDPAAEKSRLRLKPPSRDSLDRSLWGGLSSRREDDSAARSRRYPPPSPPARDGRGPLDAARSSPSRGERALAARSSSCPRGFLKAGRSPKPPADSSGAWGRFASRRRPWCATPCGAAAYRLGEPRASPRLADGRRPRRRRAGRAEICVSCRS